MDTEFEKKLEWITPALETLDVDETLTRSPCAAAEVMNQGNPQHSIPGYCS